MHRIVLLSILAVGAIAAGVVASACASEGVLGALPKDAGTVDDNEGPEAEAGIEPFTLAPASEIAAGGASTCSMTASPTVRCWGENHTGSLGIGDMEPSASETPVTPTPLGDVTSISAGEYARGAIGTNGKAYLWGDAYIGPSAGALEHLPLANPIPIDTATDVARLAVGRYFTCMLGHAGDLRCIGKNDRGQLGIGSTEDQVLPSPVSGFDGPVTSIAASMGGAFACATTLPGSIYCWGNDETGWITTHQGVVAAPTKIEHVAERALAVVAGQSHACALLASRKVECWGSGEDGRLGNGQTSSSTQPVEAILLNDVTALAAGAAHTCAVQHEGGVYCWGKNNAGQASADSDSTRPKLRLAASFAATSVSCGRAHCCARNAAANTACWGDNTSFQLGTAAL